MPLHSEYLTERSKGEKLTAAEWSAIVRSNKMQTDIKQGFVLDGSTVAKTNLQSVPKYTEFNTASEDIPPYSIFGISKAGEAYKLGSKNTSSPYVILTNVEVGITQGSSGSGQIINMWDIVKLRCAKDKTPLVGQPCGIELDSFLITKELNGFICMSNAEDEGTYNYVWAMRSRDPISLIGEVIEEITPYTKPECGRGTFGVGKIRVRYRTPNKKCVDEVVTPWGDGSELYEETVYNYLNHTFAVGDMVKAEDALGVGLVVESKFETSTPTTTTTPEPENPCGGKCKWTYSTVTLKWTKVSDTCTETTTTTVNPYAATTTTTVNPYATTTTTCECPTTTADPTATTTTTTPEPCQCAYPDFCGLENGDCTWTSCFPGETNEVECTTTTTVNPYAATTTTTPCNCNTTTTGAANPNCGGTCEWVYTVTQNWSLIENGCTDISDCNCAQPSSLFDPDCGDRVFTNCVQPIPPCIACECEGGCNWLCDGNGNWIFVNAGSYCHPSPYNCVGCTTCGCLPPSVSCDVCASMTNTPCFRTGYTSESCETLCGLPTTTTTSTPGSGGGCSDCYPSTTTTGVPGGCEDGECLYRCNGSEWELLTNTCIPCGCAEPNIACTETCQVEKTSCSRQQPTTTTTTSAPGCCPDVDIINSFISSQLGGCVFWVDVPAQRVGTTYQWKHSGLTECGDVVNAVYTCDPTAQNCNDAWNVFLDMPCITDFSFTITEDTCDCPTQREPTGVWTGSGENCNCCGFQSSQATTTTTVAPVTTTTTTASAAIDCSTSLDAIGASTPNICVEQITGNLPGESVSTVTLTFVNSTMAASYRCWENSAWDIRICCNASDGISREWSLTFDKSAGGGLATGDIDNLAFGDQNTTNGVCT